MRTSVTVEVGTTGNELVIGSIVIGRGGITNTHGTLLVQGDAYRLFHPVALKGRVELQAFMGGVCVFRLALPKLTVAQHVYVFEKFAQIMGDLAMAA
jgi:hypothetical protein